MQIRGFLSLSLGIWFWNSLDDDNVDNNDNDNVDNNDNDDDQAWIDFYYFFIRCFELLAKCARPLNDDYVYETERQNNGEWNKVW